MEVSRRRPAIEQPFQPDGASGRPVRAERYTAVYMRLAAMQCSLAAKFDAAWTPVAFRQA